MVAVAIPPVLELIHAAGAAVAAWYGGKAVVETGKAIQQHMAQSGASPSAAAQSEDAKNKADETLVVAPATQTCAECQPPPDCKERNNRISKRRNELAERHDKMLRDEHELYNNHHDLHEAKNMAVG